MPLPNVTILCGDAGHKTKQGKPCINPAMENGACWRHGGPSLKGIAHPNYQGKGRSRYILPLGLQERYEARKQDERLLSLEEDVALVDTRISQLLERIQDGESGALWQSLKAAAQAMGDAQKANDALGVANALNEMLGLIGKGHADSAIWDQIINLVGKRAQLAAMERKAQVEAKQVVTVTQAMVAMQTLVEAVKDEVDKLNIPQVEKRTLLSAVQSTYLHLTGVPERGPANALPAGRTGNAG